MPKNLTADTASFPAQTAPLAGEPRTAGSLETPLQNAADRTGYLKDRLDNIDPTREGVRRLRRFASIAAMRASVDYPDKAIAQVDGVGIYQFDAASDVTPAEPFVVTPDAISGNGRWLWSAYGALNVANGLPQLDGSGKLPMSLLAASDGTRILATSVRNGIVDFKYGEDAVGATTSSSFTLVDVPTPQLSFSAQVGDYIRIWATCKQDNPDSHSRVQLAVTKPDTTTAAVSFMRRVAAGEYGWSATPITMVGVYVVSAAGTHVVKLRHCREDAGACTTADIMLLAELIRP